MTGGRKDSECEPLGFRMGQKERSTVSFSRIINARSWFSPAALVLVFSAAWLLPGGCPQPVGPADSSSTSTNNDALVQDSGNPNDGYQAPDQDGSQLSGDSPAEVAPDDPGSGDQAGPGGPAGDGSDDGTGDDSPTAVETGGDMNGDGKVDVMDIRGFVLALMDPNAYEQAYPNGDLAKADVNGDGKLNGYDIDAFRELILGQ
jgi:hypothetical protein